MKKTKWLCFVFFIAVAFIVYYPILSNQLLDFWDDQWVVMNFYTDVGVSWQNLWSILTTYYHGQYAPFNEYLYLFLHEAFGYNAFYFHLASLLLHTANVFLVYLVFKKILALAVCKNELMNRYLPCTTAFVFLITTVNVESVAWMSASKILVYAFFYLLAALFLLRYIESGGSKKRYIGWTYLFFVCSFLGKEQAVTFPVFALLLYWFLGYSTLENFRRVRALFLLSCVKMYLSPRPARGAEKDRPYQSDIYTASFHVIPRQAREQGSFDTPSIDFLYVCYLKN